MTRGTRRTAAVLLAASALVLGACGGSSSNTDGTVTPESTQGEQQVSEDTIIDVRTVAEHAAGHLEPALNLDLQDGTFEQALAGLDKSASYLLYCRSGNRSGIAMQMMLDAGFTNVKNLGSLEDASATLGLPIVD